MDNKQAIEIIKYLQEYYNYSNIEFTDVPFDEEDNQALDKAIASLEKWDQVKKDILSRTIINDKPGTYESGVSNGLSIALAIIEEHLI